METQKIVNLLNGSDNDNSKFATKKWYIIDNETKGDYSQNDEIKFLTRSIESSAPLKNVEQKYMKLLLIRQISLILQYLCTI